MSITAMLQGGLGNQLFIYAATASAALRLKTPLVLDTSWLAVDPNHRNFELEPIVTKDVIVQSELWLPSREFVQRSQILRTSLTTLLYYRTLLRRNLYRESELFEYDFRFGDLQSGSTLWGYFQHPAYLEPVAAEMKQLIDSARFDTRTEDWMRKVREWISSLPNPICVHVRRGDYENAGTREFHGLLPSDYYRKGIAELEFSTGSGQVVVFSDSRETARKLLEFRPDALFLREPSWVSSFAILAIARSFSRFVIANSSFSWWWAWSSGSQHVIAPTRWISGDKSVARRICPSPWTLI